MVLHYKKKQNKNPKKQKTKQKLEFLLTNHGLCHVWLTLAEWFRRRSQKCKKKVTDGQPDRQRKDRQTDGHPTKNNQKSSL